MSDFPPQLPHGELHEALPNLFYVQGQVRPNFGGGELKLSRSMAVVREGEDLTLVNTMRLDDTGLAKLDSLGKVKHLVKLGAYHGRDDAFYVDRYGATMWAMPGMPHDRGVKTDREFGPGDEGPVSDGELFVFETSSSPESILVLEREGGVLLTCDALHHMPEPDEYFDEASAEKLKSFFHPANIGPGWLRAAKPDRSDFDRLLELEFKHLLTGHGIPLLNEAPAAVRATVERVFG